MIDKVRLWEFQNAASVASLMLKTEVMIADLPEEKGDGMPGGMGGGMF